MSACDAFMALLDAQVGEGVYVWGGDGEVLDTMADAEGWIARHETTEDNAARAVALYRKRKNSGVTPIRAFDCSGLVFWALHTLGLQKSDVSSRGLYALCKAIEEQALTKGDLVFRHNGTQIVHVGVCVGDGSTVECRGRAYGVVRTRRSGYWNRFGRLCSLHETAEAASDGATVVILGRSVSVRSGASTAYRRVGIAHRGERYPLLSRADSGWYAIPYKDKTAYVTNCARYTEVQNG